jgi:hypothetical protein
MGRSKKRGLFNALTGFTGLVSATAMLPPCSPWLTENASRHKRSQVSRVIWTRRVDLGVPQSCIRQRRGTKM